MRILKAILVVLAIIILLPAAIRGSVRTLNDWGAFDATFVIRVVDQDGNAVPGAYVQVGTKTFRANKHGRLESQMKGGIYPIIIWDGDTSHQGQIMDTTLRVFVGLPWHNHLAVFIRSDGTTIRADHGIRLIYNSSDGSL